MPNEDDEDYEKEGGDTSDKEGVAIPEEFQQKVHELLSDVDNREQLDYVRSCCSKCDEKMRKEETQKEKGKNPKTMGAFSDSEMPRG